MIFSAICVDEWFVWTGQSSRKLFAVICQSKVIQDAGGGSHKGDRASASFVDTKGCLFSAAVVNATQYFRKVNICHPV